MDKAGGGGGLALDAKQFRPVKRRQSLDPTGFDQFPINLPACREAAPPQLTQQMEKRSPAAPPFGEMDFFSFEKKLRPTVLNFPVKKEEQLITVNTGLQLANTGSDQSMVDEDEKEAGKTELEEMQAELGRVTEENQKLRGMLSQVTNSYCRKINPISRQPMLKDDFSYLQNQKKKGLNNKHEEEGMEEE